MWGTLGRSWEYARTSYGIIWQHKRLMIFPLLSSVALVLVLASFLVPLWASGQLQTWLDAMEQDRHAGGGAFVITTFLFYLVNYFVIVFFNCALIACALTAMEGQEPTIRGGLKLAVRRLPQILAWAVVSAVVGVLLRVIENTHEKVGRIVASILGMAWAALTYLVVPVLVVEGVGPAAAFKRSVATLKRTWGTALVGNFSIGLLGFLVMLPVFLVAGLILYGTLASGSLPLAVIGMTVAGVLVGFGVCFTSAADTVFKGVLYYYATDRPLPEQVDRAAFADAFASKG